MNNNDFPIEDDFLTRQDKLLLKEAGLSSSCIGQGLTSLRKANFVTKWNYYQAFFLLTIGIERLLKIIIITNYRAENGGAFPSNKYLKGLGHDIKQLIAITEGYNYGNYKPKPITDEIQLDIVDFLTIFAKTSRYYNIDALAEGENQNDPLSDWKKIQNKIKVKEGLESLPLGPELVAFIDSFSSIIQHDEDGNLISGAESFYKDSSIGDKLQGYSVYAVYKVIQNLGERLHNLEYLHNSILSLREFFPYFINGWDEDIDVVLWQDWNYLK